MGESMTVLWEGHHRSETVDERRSRREREARGADELRARKLARLKAGIAAGTYWVSTFDVAESLMQYMLVLP